MKKQPSTQWAYLKVMLLIPLVAILLQGFSQTGHKSGYLKLTTEQLKLIGIECNPEGVFYKNHNPDWQKEKNRYAILAFLLTDDVYCSNINLQENEKISGMGSAGKYLMKLPETNHTFNPCMVTSFAGSRTWDAYTVLGDSTMKLLPVQLNMADYGMKSRKDTILFWFVPTESLKTILAPVADINDYLVTPPPQPRR